MPKVTAIREVRYGGKTYRLGDTFEVRAKDVRLMTEAKNASATLAVDAPPAKREAVFDPPAPNPLSPTPPPPPPAPVVSAPRAPTRRAWIPPPVTPEDEAAIEKEEAERYARRDMRARD